MGVRLAQRLGIASVLAIALAVSSGISSANAHRRSPAPAVRLSVSPSVVSVGQGVRLRATNGTGKTIIWGGCFDFQRLVHGVWEWSGPHVECLAQVFVGPHSSILRGAALPAPHPPGRYRAVFIYHPHSTAITTRYAYAYFTVARPCGFLTGRIVLVGEGDPLAGPTPTGGLVTVFTPTGRPVDHERVRQGKPFRFRLVVGQYIVVAGKALNEMGSPPKTVSVRAKRTTHADVEVVCTGNCQY